jgi:hypothetical protein
MSANETEQVDPEVAEVLAMIDEEVTLYLARAGISPADLDAMWRRSVEKWANDPDPVVAAFGRSMQRTPKSQEKKP